MIWHDHGEVEAAVAAVVAVVPLDGTGQGTRETQGRDELGETIDHRQGTTGAAWRERDNDARGAPGRHLEYSVAIVSPTTDSLDPTGHTLGVVADCRVTFAYRVRSGAQRSDRRAALALAWDVVRWIVGAGPEDVTLTPRGVVELGKAGEWVEIELQFTVAFDLSM